MWRQCNRRGESLNKNVVVGGKLGVVGEAREAL